MLSIFITGPGWPSGWSRLRGRRVSGLKPDSIEDPPRMWAWFTLYLTSCVKRPSTNVVRKFGEGMFAQELSSSADRGSNLRSPPQNSPYIASKRDANVTKLNHLLLIIS
ncbi:hypothetical protein AVEN_143787-1 [Araneus ventricosus]|uniref:Uncharacterized protein n=1 Tax=Araneus ventricosus TaxID=182803 RepID=A0A4Y2AQL0_ARAVE|nr:hypothetical protein AVEN_143787-1 [Araneus ventricosus]